jgi:hypothetical protein
MILVTKVSVMPSPGVFSRARYTIWRVHGCRTDVLPATNPPRLSVWSANSCAPFALSDQPGVAEFDYSVVRRRSGNAVVELGALSV